MRRPLAYAKDLAARRRNNERVGLVVVAVHDWEAGKWFEGRPEVARLVVPDDLLLADDVVDDQLRELDALRDVGDAGLEHREVQRAAFFEREQHQHAPAIPDAIQPARNRAGAKFFFSIVHCREIG